jgi:hypothetical protein
MTDSDSERTKTKKPLIRLKDGDESSVFVDITDKDTFITTASMAAHACKNQQEVIEVWETFKLFVAHVREWASKKTDLVRRVYVGGDGGNLKVFVILKGDDYNFDFEDELIDLRFALHEKYPSIPCDVLQLPDVPQERLSGFFPASATAVFDCQASKNI